jgi:hypothetical protein
MKKLIVIFAVLALPAAVALGANSGVLNASPKTFFESDLPAQIHIFGDIPSCAPGSQVTIASKALKSTHSWHGVPSVTARVLSTHKFSTHATVKQGPYATVDIPVAAYCGSSHAVAHTSISVQNY